MTEPTHILTAFIETVKAVLRFTNVASIDQILILEAMVDVQVQKHMKNRYKFSCLRTRRVYWPCGSAR